MHHGIKAEADLFLDTVAYGAHITAVDSLWAGVPIVTLVTGERMAKRIAQALVKALGMGQGGSPLLASTLKGYEDAAATLAGPG